MYNIRYVILFVFVFLSFPLAQQNSLRVMTYNIRYANENPGEEWSLRKNDVAEMIKFHEPDIFGLQEALFEQVDFLLQNFENFRLVGVGREDGLKGGEFSPLFISKQFNILDYGTFWISETPDIPSLGWDASYKRIATWAIIEGEDSEDSLFVINTHLDHQGVEARLEGIKLLIRRISELSENLPIVLTGDFNFTSESEPFKTIQNYGLVVDANEISENHYGTEITFNGFEKESTNNEKIDYVFVSDKINVYQHAIISDKINGSYPSDHMPVIIDFSVKY